MPAVNYTVQISPLERDWVHVETCSVEFPPALKLPDLTAHGSTLRSKQCKCRRGARAQSLRVITDEHSDSISWLHTRFEDSAFRTGGGETAQP
ncbi:hypothetical protein Y1Q_0016668 [Alligator mississippiensis]|uniref:Uncharacterized protein n=1 Tax=Alligator mississippiensis TaxID=8496 RepID=A0A151P1D5_ALLMI|nr:hypothetical protein Y1Q_0016668 [Alligator mississippiensis]